MTNKATIEIFRQGQWQVAAYLTPGHSEQGHLGECSFEYAPEYTLHYGDAELHPNAGVSCEYPVSFEWHDLTTWPAFMLDLMPGGAGRDHWLKRLDIADGLSADWPLLIHGTGSPPGNLRIKEAADKRSATIPVPNAAGELVALNEHPGFSYDDILNRQEHFIEYAFQNGAQTAGASDVQGVAPKFLLVQDHAGQWHAEGALSDDRIASHWLIKFPRGTSADDRLILKNEAAYMKVAQALELGVAALLAWQNNTLLIPRFDRQVTDKKQVIRLGMESLYSVVGVSRYGTEYGGTVTHDQCAEGLARYCSNPDSALLLYIKRDICNVVMGNTDNHARNTAVLRDETGDVSLSPLFDFAPMYCDPQGISRACRWEGELENAGRPVWGKIIEAFAPNDKRQDWARELRQFGAAIERLSDTMRTCGVDDSIIEARINSINSHSRELIALP